MTTPPPSDRPVFPGPDDGAESIGPPPRDELDAALRQWHQHHADRAAAQRDRLLETLASERPSIPGASPAGDAKPWSIQVRRIRMSRMIPLAAAAALGVVALPFIFDKSGSVAKAGDGVGFVMAPAGGRLDALDRDGALLGPCVLKHTDVRADVQGMFTRVTLTQKYHNPHRDKIEAVYTFPLSHRAAVDRMSMAIGDRVVLGQVKERNVARELYESAKAANRIASLLEQERPNIFTQSVANIDPGADINITISYVELLEQKDGEYTFAFPTVVEPRYIPGGPTWLDREARADDNLVPAIPPGFRRRAGLVLPAPGEVKFIGADGQAIAAGPMDSQQLAAALPVAVPVAFEAAADDAVRDAEVAGYKTPPTAAFEVRYPDGSREIGELYDHGVGRIRNARCDRWFVLPPTQPGTPFAAPTAQVPDADRITPMPVHPSMRAGHDLSITLNIDTGGPGITRIDAPLHNTVRQDVSRRPDGSPSSVVLSLANQAEIPNRDFVVTWRQNVPTVTEAVFTSRAPQGDFFAVMLQPPPRIDDAMAVPRELVFVLDTSGSMRGFPIEKSKELAAEMIQTMRPQDTFNVITFSGNTEILWKAARPNTDANRAEAMQFFAQRQGGGGTEMMTAINTALEQHPDGIPDQPLPLTLAELTQFPPDGRSVEVRIPMSAVERLAPSETGGGSLMVSTFLRVNPDVRIPVSGLPLPLSKDGPASVLAKGKWINLEGRSALIVDSISTDNVLAANVKPLRIVVFLTDGQVGNDMAIIDAVKRNRGTTRVFSYGIGNSVNRYLLDNIASAGGGIAEYVLLGGNQDVDAQAKRVAAKLNERTRTPVLTNIRVTFSPELAVADIEPNPESLPDVWDARPLTLLGRFVNPMQSQGTMTIRGMTAQGPWEKTITLSLAPDAGKGDRDAVGDQTRGVVSTLWARAQVEAAMNRDLAGIQAGRPDPAVRNRIIQLGETFGIMSQFTSFVAVDYNRVTIDGKARLVHVPIEMTDKTQWDGFFGPDVAKSLAEVFGRLNRPDGLGASPGDRNKKVEESIDRVRELQRERRYSDALQVVDEMLALEPDNSTGLLLKQVLRDTVAYTEYSEVEKRKQSGTSDAGPKADGPAISAKDLIDYPTDWPSHTFSRGALVDVAGGVDSENLYRYNTSNDALLARGISVGLTMQAGSPLADSSLGRPLTPSAGGVAAAPGEKDLVEQLKMDLRRDGVSKRPNAPELPAIAAASAAEPASAGQPPAEGSTARPASAAPASTPNTSPGAPLGRGSTGDDRSKTKSREFDKNPTPAAADPAPQSTGEPAVPPPPAPAGVAPSPSIAAPKADAAGPGGESNTTDTAGTVAPSPGIDFDTQTTIGMYYLRQLDRNLAIAKAQDQPAPDRLAAALGVKFAAENLTLQNEVVAVHVADHLLKTFPGNTLVVKLDELLTSTKTRDRVQQQLAPSVDMEKAKTLLIEATNAADAERKLLRRLDPKLYRMLTAPREVRASATSPADSADLVLVVLADNLDPAFTQSLRAAGANIVKSYADSKTVVLSLAASNLEALALVGGIRKIEPVN